MPNLQNAQYEAFALARARGASLNDAYEDAGYAPGNGHASRVALREEVAERIAELRREHAEAGDASPQAIIASLVRMSKANEGLKSVEGMRKAAEPDRGPSAAGRAGQPPRQRPRRSAPFS